MTAEVNQLRKFDSVGLATVLRKSAIKRIGQNQASKTRTFAPFKPERRNQCDHLYWVRLVAK